MAKVLADRVLEAQLALETYAELQLGMKLFDRKVAQASE
jgi:hypothetical protein